MAAEPNPRNVIFDLGGVLIDWDPRHLYRKLFDGDEPAMERFLAEVCTPGGTTSLDAGRPFAEAVAELVERHPHERRADRGLPPPLDRDGGGADRPTVAILEELDGRGVPLWALTNWSTETFALVRGDPAYAFLDRFRAIFVSGELRLVKPDPAIFRHAWRRSGPRRALPVHRRLAQNVAAAAELGSSPTASPHRTGCARIWCASAC